MKSEKDWLSEVWKIKRDLSREAMKMGIKKYLDFAEKEAEKIISERRKDENIVVKDKGRKNYKEK